MTVVARPRSPRRRAARLAGDALAARYARMAHDFQRRPVDAVLRAFDVVLSASAWWCSPRCSCSARWRCLTSGKPILYRGARVGRAGRVFAMYKFRSLRPDAEQRLGPTSARSSTRGRSSSSRAPAGCCARPSSTSSRSSTTCCAGT